MFDITVRAEDVVDASGQTVRAMTVTLRTDIPGAESIIAVNKMEKGSVLYDEFDSIAKEMLNLKIQENRKKTSKQVEIKKSRKKKTNA